MVCLVGELKAASRYGELVRYALVDGRCSYKYPQEWLASFQERESAVKRLTVFTSKSWRDDVLDSIVGVCEWRTALPLSIRAWHATASETIPVAALFHHLHAPATASSSSSPQHTRFTTFCPRKSPQSQPSIPIYPIASIHAQCTPTRSTAALRVAIMNGLKADPDIKMDPDAGTPSGSGYMDDDFFEDTGEMSMPPKGVDKDIWLTRVPKWLYEKISKWEDFAEGKDDDEIEIGEILYFPNPAQKTVDREKEMRVFLNDRWRDKTQLPQAFYLQPMTDKKDKEVLASTYVFSEKDLPGYKPTGWGYGQGNRGNFGGVQDPKARIQKRTKFKKAIPSMCIYVRKEKASPLTTSQSKPHYSAAQRASTTATLLRPKNSSPSRRAARATPSKATTPRATSSPTQK